MYLTPHFSLAELTHSRTAARLGMANRPDDTAQANLLITAQMLERIRAKLCELAGRDISIQVTSGYRCLALNRAIHSKDSSAHVSGLAADWIAPRFGTPFEVCSALEPHVRALGIGQLIHEFGQWVHTGVPLAKPGNRIITISHAGTVPGIVEA